MSQHQTSILFVGDGSGSARAAAQWARRFVREQRARCLETPPSATTAMALDIATKEEVQYLVTGLPCRADGAIAEVEVDGELAVLMRRAPCPLWTIQPWA